MFFYTCPLYLSVLAKVCLHLIKTYFCLSKKCITVYNINDKAIIKHLVVA